MVLFLQRMHKVSQWKVFFFKEYCEVALGQFADMCVGVEWERHVQVGSPLNDSMIKNHKSSQYLYTRAHTHIGYMKS